MRGIAYFSRSLDSVPDFADAAFQPVQALVGAVHLFLDLRDHTGLFFKFLCVYGVFFLDENTRQRRREDAHQDHSGDHQKNGENSAGRSLRVVDVGVTAGDKRREAPPEAFPESGTGLHVFQKHEDACAENKRHEAIEKGPFEKPHVQRGAEVVHTPPEEQSDAHQPQRPKNPHGPQKPTQAYDAEVAGGGNDLHRGKRNGRDEVDPVVFPIPLFGMGKLVLEDEVGHENGAAHHVDDPQDPQRAHREVGMYFHNRFLVFRAAIYNVHPGQFSGGHVPGNECAGPDRVHNVYVHPLISGARLRNQDLADLTLFHFRRCRRAASAGADAEQIHDKDRDQKQDEKEDDDVLHVNVPDAAQNAGLPVHQMFLLEGLFDDPGLVLQPLSFLVQRRNPRIRRVQVQFVAAMLLVQGDRVRTSGQPADLLFLFFGQLGGRSSRSPLRPGLSSS